VDQEIQKLLRENSGEPGASPPAFTDTTFGDNGAAGHRYRQTLPGGAVGRM
jgi:hypothetical protein